MSFAVEVVAQRDDVPQLNAMLAVVDACASAGISYPAEVTEFFGDALQQHGSDAARLRSAMEKLVIPVNGDVMADGGVTIRLADIPKGVSVIRIRARQSSNSSAPPRSSLGLQSPDDEVPPEVVVAVEEALAGDNELMDFGDHDTSAALDAPGWPTPDGTAQPSSQAAEAHATRPTTGDEMLEFGGDEVSLEFPEAPPLSEPADQSSSVDHHGWNEDLVGAKTPMLDFGDENETNDFGPPVKPTTLVQQEEPDGVDVMESVTPPQDEDTLNFDDLDSSDDLRDELPSAGVAEPLPPLQDISQGQSSEQAAEQIELAPDEGLLDLDGLDVTEESETPEEESPWSRTPSTTPVDEIDDLMLAVEDDLMDLDNIDPPDDSEEPLDPGTFEDLDDPVR